MVIKCLLNFVTCPKVLHCKDIALFDQLFKFSKAINPCITLEAEVYYLRGLNFFVPLLQCTSFIFLSFFPRK